MALQDLTPQLRTRLSRMERAVGWFVLLATALLVFGFAYYVYNTAERKGWFKARASYFTFTERATGLNVGDPVMLMGFDVGRITRIDTMPPGDWYDVYVEFEIKQPYYGYLWTVGSRAKIATADFLGKRVLEVTKGTNGVPAYIFHPLKELTLEEAEALPQIEKWRLADDIYTEDTNGLNLVLPALTPLARTNLQRLASLGRTQIRVLDTNVERKSPTAVWHDKEGRYVKFIPRDDPRTKLKKNLYWLPSDESAAVTERLENIVGQVEKALPSFLSLTNQIISVLSNTFGLTSNLNTIAIEARPVATNLAYLSAQLREPGSFGEWLLGANVQRQVSATLENANATLGHADTNLTALFANLALSLDNLAGITSNLNAQVQSNTNMLGAISKAVIDADDLVQGLKRHWLLRSAFRTKTNATTAPAVSPRLGSPKDQEKR